MSNTAAEKYRQRIEKDLDTAIAKATRLVLAKDFDAAEEMVRYAERHFSESRGVNRLYLGAIASLGGKDAAVGDRALIRAIFDRLIYRPPSAHPEPHTQEEAERFWKDDEREHARVVKLVGFDPTLWPDDQPGAVDAAVSVRMLAASKRKRVTVVAITILAIAVVVALIASLT
ncbi:MAG: hypothetical protein U0640_00790 [Phycisphaerales bacterium]